MHLTIISYPSSVDDSIEDAVSRIDGCSDPASRSVARCDQLGEVSEKVKNIVYAFNPPKLVRRLDLYGHGHPGSITIGDTESIDTEADSIFWQDLEELQGALLPNADVRLLGCDTGACTKGFELIRTLAHRLGQQRVVWAPRAVITWSDFGPQGFKEEVASRYLVSSRDLSRPMPGLIRPSSTPGEGQEKHAKWFEHLPAGYQHEGYGEMPAATLDGWGSTREGDQEVTVTVRGARRVIAITSGGTRGRHYLFRWLSCTEAPPLDALAERLSVELRAS
jgi:hypothetical protein